jgi:hypothetical protein
MAGAVIAAKPVQGVGFLCTNDGGATRRINVDVQKKRYQEAGGAPKKIYDVDEATVTLLLYTTFRDGFFKSEKIDRTTLVLESTFMGGGYITTDKYQCQMVPPFDFAADRKF